MLRGGASAAVSRTATQTRRSDVDHHGSWNGCADALVKHGDKIQFGAHALAARELADGGGVVEGLMAELEGDAPAGCRSRIRASRGRRELSKSPRGIYPALLDPSSESVTGGVVEVTERGIYPS